MMGVVNWDFVLYKFGYDVSYVEIILASTLLLLLFMYVRVHL
jgi:hypothetical protein